MSGSYMRDEIYCIDIPVALILVNQWYNLFWDAIFLLLIENVIPILVHWFWNTELILSNHWVNYGGPSLIEHNIGGYWHKVVLNLVGLHNWTRFLARIKLIL